MIAQRNHGKPYNGKMSKPIFPVVGFPLVPMRQHWQPRLAGCFSYHLSGLGGLASTKLKGEGGSAARIFTNNLFGEDLK